VYGRLQSGRRRLRPMRPISDMLSVLASFVVVVVHTVIEREAADTSKYGQRQRIAKELAVTRSGSCSCATLQRHIFAVLGE